MVEFHLLDFLKPYGLCLAAQFIGLALPAMSVLQFSGHIAARMTFAVICCLTGVALFALGIGYSFAAPDPAYEIAQPNPVRAAIMAAAFGAVAATAALAAATAVHIRNRRGRDAPADTRATPYRAAPDGKRTQARSQAT